MSAKMVASSCSVVARISPNCSITRPTNIYVKSILVFIDYRISYVLISLLQNSECKKFRNYTLLVKFLIFDVNFKKFIRVASINTTSEKVIAEQLQICNVMEEGIKTHRPDNSRMAPINIASASISGW